MSITGPIQSSSEILEDFTRGLYLLYACTWNELGLALEFGICFGLMTDES
jgi:hypothetical protein